jgi:hypothetical protein
MIEKKIRVLLMKIEEEVVDEDWRGGRCWWRVKIEEDVINDGKKRERQRAVDEESKTKD